MIDIESFFYYQDKHNYLREAHSVLCEDGRLYLAFFLQRTKLEEVHNWLKMYFSIEVEDDITDNAIQSMRLDSQKL